MKLILAAALLAATVPASAETIKPIVHPRASWGALEEIDDKSIESLYIKDKRPDRITLHHTDIAISEDQMDLARNWLKLSPDRRVGAAAVGKAQAAEHLREVQKLHLMRGWNDIGYHFMIDWMGRIYEGRPVGVLGAHAEEENRGNIGIALLGNLDRHEPSVPQQAAVERLVRWLAAKHKIQPKKIMAHRDLGNTDCPGRHFYGWVESARTGAITAKVPAPERAVGELLKPWVPGRPGFADTRLAQRLFDGLLPK